MQCCISLGVVGDYVTLKVRNIAFQTSFAVSITMLSLVFNFNFNVVFLVPQNFNVPVLTNFADEYLCVHLFAGYEVNSRYPNAGCYDVVSHFGPVPITLSSCEFRPPVVTGSECILQYRVFTAVSLMKDKLLHMRRYMYTLEPSVFSRTVMHVR